MARVSYRDDNDDDSNDSAVVAIANSTNVYWFRKVLFVLLPASQIAIDLDHLGIYRPTLFIFISFIQKRQLVNNLWVWWRVAEM